VRVRLPGSAPTAIVNVLPSANPARRSLRRSRRCCRRRRGTAPAPDRGDSQNSSHRASV
jgi:hypothetical protein